MKKILICTGNLAGGGAEKVLVNLLKKVDYTKCKITLVLVWRHGVYLDKINENVEIKYIWPDNRNVLKNIRIMKLIPQYFYNKYLDGDYDLEISFLEGITTNLMSHSKNTKSIKLAWVHTNIKSYHWTKNEFMSKFFEKKSYSKFNKIVFVSKDSKEGFVNMYGFEDKVEVIHNSIDLEEIQVKAKEKINITGEYCLTIGRLIPEKGYERLINQFSKYTKINNKLKLVIIGDGWMKEHLNKLIIERKMEKNIIMIPFDENPYKYIKNCKFFICSSIIEGYSLVVAEALCLNKAIITTDCKGVRSVVDNGRYGIIVENSDEGIYKGLIDINRNKSIIEEYEKRITDSVKKKFTIEKQIQSIYSLVKKIED